MIRRTAVAAMLALSAQPAIACSGDGPIGHALSADVIVEGQITASDHVVARRILKGAKASRYKIAWPPVDPNDECAFLGPNFRDRGVFFLKRTDHRSYVVMWTERRWNTRWGKYL